MYQKVNSAGAYLPAYVFAVATEESIQARISSNFKSLYSFDLKDGGYIGENTAAFKLDYEGKYAITKDKKHQLTLKVLAESYSGTKNQSMPF